MKILAIETSCDETGVSILEIKKTKQGQVFKVLANALSSQVKIHAPYGGVYPMLAKREHIKNLPILLEKVLKGSGGFREGSVGGGGWGVRGGGAGGGGGPETKRVAGREEGGGGPEKPARA